MNDKDMKCPACNLKGLWGSKHGDFCVCECGRSFSYQYVLGYNIGYTEGYKKAERDQYYEEARQLHG
jgi:hypothetical protein